MLQFTQKMGSEPPLPEPPNTDFRISLPYDERKKSRLKTLTACGREVGIILPRGSQLKAGDIVASAQGVSAFIDAEKEAVSRIVPGDIDLLLKAAYHLGNRHVAVELNRHWLQYQRDHVLDAMLTGMGIAVIHEYAPFEPESGAYAVAHAHD